MPRKSAAARMTPQIGERPRLQPPSSLSTRERQLFRHVVASLSPEHLKAEDLPLLTLYVRGLCQCENAAREIASGSTDKFWLELQAAGLKAVNTMAVRLRIGAKARAPSNQRKPGSAQSALPLPWEGNPWLRAVPRDDGDGNGERRFSDLLDQLHDRRPTISDFIGAKVSEPTPPEPIVSLAATEGAEDVAAFVGASA